MSVDSLNILVKPVVEPENKIITTNYEVSHSKRFDKNVYISTKATQELADFIIKENWGENNIVLYKYLDNIWRSQLINKQVKQFNDEFGFTKLIFNTGLKDRIFEEEVFIIMKPNTKPVFDQKWRLPYQNAFLLTKDLIKKYKFTKNDIPKKSVFNFENTKDSVFHSNYDFKIYWKYKLNNSKYRILGLLEGTFI